MFIFLILTIIAIFAAIVTFSNTRRYSTSDIVGFCSIPVVFYLFVLVVIFSTSWGSAVRIDVNYEEILSQYPDAIRVCGQEAIIDMDQVYADAAKSKYTDLIIDLRKRIADNNAELMDKKRFDENLFFSWVTIMPTKVKFIRIE